MIQLRRPRGFAYDHPSDQPRLGPMSLLPVLDVLAVVTAFLAALFWFLASARTVRRISHLEELDAADINRLVVVINRNQLLNRRGALAAAVSALYASIRLLATFLERQRSSLSRVHTNLC